MAPPSLPLVYSQRVSTAWSIGSHARCSFGVILAGNSRHTVHLRRQARLSSRSLGRLRAPLDLQPCRASTAPDSCLPNTANRSVQKASSSNGTSAAATAATAATAAIEQAVTQAHSEAEQWQQDTEQAAALHHDGASSSSTGNSGSDSSHDISVKGSEGTAAAVAAFQEKQSQKRASLAAGRPASPGWFHDILGAAATAAAAASQQQQQHTSTTPGSPAAAAAPGLPLPLLWEIPRAIQQLASRSQSPSTQQSLTTATPAAGFADTRQSSLPRRSVSPSQQTVLPRALATSLRHLQPRPVHSSSSLHTPPAAAAAAAAGLDSNAVQLVHVLQQLRGVMSDESWEGFVNGVQLQAADALQLTAVETTVSASMAAEESIYDDLFNFNGEGDKTAATTVAETSLPITAIGVAAAAAAAAGTDGELRGLASMSMSGRHMITQLPAVSSNTAINMQKQQQQQVRRLQHQEQQQQQQQQQQDEEQQVEGISNTAAAAVAAAAAQEQLKHEVASKLQTLRGQLKQYTDQHHQQQQQQQQQQQHHQQQQQQKGAAAAAAGGESVLNFPLKCSSTKVTAQTLQQIQQQIDTSVSFEEPAAPTNSQGDLSSSSMTISSSTAFPKYEYLVFGGGGARCFGYAGALHALRQLGLMGRLKGVSGSSGGAVYALLAALRFSVSEVQAAMGTLPETESLSWLRLNSRLGLSDGEATFRQIEAAIATKLGIPHPSLADVAAAAGCPITLAATSLARRAPVYLSSTTHPDMPVRDALRASCAIPFFFTPLRVAGSSSSSSAGVSDLLVDGCITDCTPLAGLSVGGGGWDPSRTLVLAVHDAAGLESPDFQGLLSGLISTVMQAGVHHTLAAGIDLLNLWPAVAGVNPLQFRMPGGQARDVIARSQALAEEFAVNKMKQWAAAAARPAVDGSSVSGSVEYANSVVAGMGSSSSGSRGAADEVVTHNHQPATGQPAASQSAAAGVAPGGSKHVPQRHLMEGGHQAMAGMVFDSIADADDTSTDSSSSSSSCQVASSSTGNLARHHLVGYDSYLSYDNGMLTDEDWDESDLAGFRGWEEHGDDDEEAPMHRQQQQQAHQQQQQQQQQHLQGSRAPTEGVQWLAGLDGAGLAGLFSTAAAAAGEGEGAPGSDASSDGGKAPSMYELSSRWLGRLAVERLLRAALLNAKQTGSKQIDHTQREDNKSNGSDSLRSGAVSTKFTSHLSDGDWRVIEEVLQQQEQILLQQEQAAATAQQQQQQGSAAPAATETCGLSSVPKELVIVDNEGISQVCLVTVSTEELETSQRGLLSERHSNTSASNAGHESMRATGTGAPQRASLSSLAANDRDCVVPIVSSMEEQSMFD